MRNSSVKSREIERLYTVDGMKRLCLVKQTNAVAVTRVHCDTEVKFYPILLSAVLLFIP